MNQASNSVVCAVLILLLVMSGGCAREEPGVEIPLDKIWGHGIPETQSIHLLELEQQQKLPEQERSGFFQNSSLMQQIYTAIERQEDKQPIGPGFAVAGSGREALAAVEEAMEQNRIPSQTFPAGTEVSLFFFTRKLGVGFQLKEIRQSKERVTIHYQFGSDGTERFRLPASTRYFALIPLGKPGMGNVLVKTIELSTKKKHGKNVRTYYKQRAEKRVCKSFTFAIVSADTEIDINK